MNSQEIAEKSSEIMWESDSASKWFGMSIESVAPGYAQLTLNVEKHHCNGHGNCHGAISFALADSAFAFACNSYNERCVDQHNMITYLRPISSGDVLRAEAREVSRSRNSGIYDVCVKNQEGKVCVEMRGFSRKVEGSLF